MWKAVEASTSEVGMGETERGRSKGGKGEGEEEETEKRENSGSKESSRRVGDIGQRRGSAKSEAETKKLVPEKFHRWIKVFGKKQSERMPIRKLWDHAIDVKEGFVPRKGKVYLLSKEEREEVREFVKEQLRKEYIRLFKLPQTALVFFVGKKDGKKRMVQDYRYLNEWTIKNNYPLPLISDVLENIGTKKLFTKMDLRWGYNNVKIKEGDE